jgi:hypothetical protein
MPTKSLEDLKFNDEEKITANTEPEGAELSTFTQFGGDVSGEIGTKDKRIPRINIGQKSGALGESKGYGAIILNKNDVIVPFGQNVPFVTVIKIAKVLQERREYDPNSTTMPKTFPSSREALSAGFNVGWTNNRDDKIVLPIAHLLLMFAAPEGLDEDVINQNFFYDFEGKHYGAAIHTTSPSGYEAAKTIFTSLDTPKVRECGLRVTNWIMSSQKITKMQNSWYVLKLTAKGFNNPEFIEFTKSIFPEKA